MDTGVAAIIVAGIAAVASIVTAFIAVHNSGKLEVIHVLVNSQLQEIKDKLRAALDGEREAVLQMQALLAERAAERAADAKGGAGLT